jgi:hypothetical protein
VLKVAAEPSVIYVRAGDLRNSAQGWPRRVAGEATLRRPLWQTVATALIHGPQDSPIIVENRANYSQGVR